MDFIPAWDSTQPRSTDYIKASEKLQIEGCLGLGLLRPGLQTIATSSRNTTEKNCGPRKAMLDLCSGFRALRVHMTVVSDHNSQGKNLSSPDYLLKPES